MKKILVTMMMCAFAVVSKAETINSIAAEAINQVLQSDEFVIQALEFKVGDMANYNLKMGIIKGSMIMTVKAVTDTEVVIEQLMDLGFAGKQNCEMTIDPTTGQVKSLVCNGQKQDPGEKGDIEIIETKEDKITVPAGTFVCYYVKAKEKTKNVIIEQWVNLKQVPVFGMVKTIAPSQLGQVTLELKAFKKN